MTQLSGGAHDDLRWNHRYLWFGGLIAISVFGCNRGVYRRSADRQTYSIVAEKGAGPNWAIQPGFTINPDSRSRFFDPTSPTDPALPIPAPQLYQYQLPSLVTPAAEPRDLAADANDETVIEGMLPLPAESPSGSPTEDTSNSDRTFRICIYKIRGLQFSKSSKLSSFRHVTERTPPNPQCPGIRLHRVSGQPSRFLRQPRSSVVRAAGAFDLNVRAGKVPGVGRQSEQPAVHKTGSKGKHRAGPEELPAPQVWPTTLARDCHHKFRPCR